MARLVFAQNVKAAVDVNLLVASQEPPARHITAEGRSIAFS